MDSNISLTVFYEKRQEYKIIDKKIAVKTKKLKAAECTKDRVARIVPSTLPFSRHGLRSLQPENGNLVETRVSELEWEE